MKLAVLFLFACLVSVSIAQQCAYCVGAVCGPDGAGGSCGTCPSGQTCSRGQCVCNRGCTGLQCGPDNCGTTCGNCLSGQTCVSGICTGPCTPQCTLSNGQVKTCGWDQCGGCCGSCPSGYRCRDGTCECYPSCNNKNCGSDGCGGSCGNCTGGAICSASTDPFPQQCYYNCLIEIEIEVRELKTNNLVGESCSISMVGPNNYVNNSVIYPGAVPGSVTVNISSGKYGSYQFTTTCTGYQVSTSTVTVNTTNQLVILLVNWNPISIVVRDQTTNNLLSTASIQITASGYSLSVSWVSPSYTWTTDGFITYTFVTASTGYQTRTTSLTLNYTTTLITLYLSANAISLSVVECVSGQPVSQATIVTGTTTINYNNGATFTPANGVPGTYTFTTSATNYVSNTQTENVQTSTTLITLCVNYRPITVIITDCTTGATINGASIQVTSTQYTTYELSFVYSSSGTTWTPVGYQGNYIWAVSASGYISVDSTQTVSPATNTISICLQPAAYCGDGVCNANESAVPTSLNYCYDCARVRGVISIAIGQKNQLTNITVSLWADPVNPALFMSNGSTIPEPTFTTLSDSKGYFTFNTLSFNAPPHQNQGSYSRRFYFSLSGTYVDTQGETSMLLDQWWNYLLYNKEWSGSGSLVGTNTSPQFYFYMTPPFFADETLIRTILSWGTDIDNPSTSIPDLDILTAGPVEPNSISTYNTGIVNFQNLAAHATDTTILPFGNLVTDSAQGFGPEVMDVFGFNSFEVGYSDTYQSGAPANAYEIWVDRPNSPANQDSASVFLYDTNSFLVVYLANTTASGGYGGYQLIFNEITGVPYAYGFYNTDQWNQIPTTATIWHVFDISQNSASGFVYNGFPGENNTADTTAYPGAKYGFGSPNFQTTKSVPCGHVSSRGANPAYCPGTITYPKSKKSEMIEASQI